MRKINLHIIRTVYPWWAKHAGYHHFLEHFDEKTFKITTQEVPHKLSDPKIISNLMGKTIRKKMPAYYTVDLIAETKAFMKYLGKTDIIHYFDGMHTPQFLPLIKFKKKPKIVVTYHHAPHLLEKWVRKDVIRKLDHVLLVSPVQRSFFESIISKDKISVILHGIDTQYYMPAPHKSLTFKCLTVGHNCRNFDIVYAVSKKLQNIEFHIVDVENTKKAQMQSLKNCVTHENISDEELLKLYQTCDILFLPLEHSTACNSLLEGIACGLPVLTLDTISTRAYLSEKSAMFLNTPEEFCDAILVLREDAEKCQQMGYWARKRAEELSWENIAPQFESFYKTLL